MTEPSRPPAAPPLELMEKWFVETVPHNRALGIALEAYGPGEATMRLPYAAHLVGNPVTGVLHGGAITALMDACCGCAVYLRIQKPIPIATLDLRIDYMKPAEPGRDVVTRCECYRTTRHVAFVRGVAHNGDPDAPIAAVAGTFMLATKKGKRRDG